MKTRFFTIIGISVTVFLMGTIVYPTINEASFDDENSHSIPNALADLPPIHPDDFKKCFDGEFFQYDWCQHHLSTQSPLKQFKAGIPINEIQCKNGLVEAIKNSNNSPACVKLETKIKLIQRGWAEPLGDVMFGRTIQPEPQPISTDHQNLIDARNKLRDTYHGNASLGPFNIQDVIVGYGIGDGILVVDILEEYYHSNEVRNFIIEKIIDITGGKVDIAFNPSNAIVPTNIESVFPYVWNDFLHRNGIEYTPKEQSYWNTGEGFLDITRVCSPIIASNGTEFFISSVFIHDPFEVTGTYIDETMPDDCHKVWRTDTILEEPDRILMLWLKNYHEGN
jgi:hypothetical protein